MKTPALLAALACSALAAGMLWSQQAAAPAPPRPPTPPLTKAELEAIPLTPPRSGKSVTKTLFDGKTLQGWKGNPDWWSVQNGAIVGKFHDKVPTSFLFTEADYPELSRITAIKGAEIICRPSALLRSADLWELTNRARAYDNHVYLIGANATGVDPAGVIYFGNSMIVTPIAEVVARAASHECWVSARLDPATALASLTPGSSVPQAFDHLADRNLALIRRHADALLAEAASPFVHGGKPDDIVD